MTPKKKPELKLGDVKQKPKSKLGAIAEAVEEALGSDLVHKGSDSHLGEPRVFIPSGVPELDEVLDREKRGWPVGRIVEIYGGEASCKTGVGYALIAEAQKLGGDAMLFPSEGNYDEWLAEKYGVDLERLVVVDDPTVEGCFEAIDRAMDVVGQEGLLVAMIDSVAGLTTRDELDEATFDRSRHAQVRALLLSQALRRIGAVIPRTNCLLFLVNQVRDADSVGPVKSKPKPPGGRAIKFYASVRLRLEVMGKKHRTKAGQKYVSGFELKITSEKNRLAKPYQNATIILDFEEGLLSKEKKKKK